MSTCFLTHFAFNKSGAGFGVHGGDGLDNFLLWTEPTKPGTVSFTDDLLLRLIFSSGLSKKGLKSSHDFLSSTPFSESVVFVDHQLLLINFFTSVGSPGKTFPHLSFPTHLQFIMVAVNHVRTFIQWKGNENISEYMFPRNFITSGQHGAKCGSNDNHGCS